MKWKVSQHFGSRRHAFLYISSVRSDISTDTVFGVTCSFTCGRGWQKKTALTLDQPINFQLLLS